MEKRSITLVGASVRAMAQSAVRAGFAPFCLDLFADTDLEAVVEGRVKRLENWPGDLVHLLPPEIPWVYTGGLENHPRLVNQLAKRAPLWGNQASPLIHCRLPWRLAETLHHFSVPTPEWAPCPPPGEESAWLSKPLRGAGGRGVATWSAGAMPRLWSRFAQRRVAGLPAAAVFAVQPGESTLLGVTRQWVGEPWLNAKGFAYCGSVGPWPVGDGECADLAALGKALLAIGLRGLVGVDLILTAGRAWVIEINPRWPASVEVLERALGIDAWGWHTRAFCATGTPNCTVEEETASAKAIVYAPRDLVFPAHWPGNEPGKHKASWADIPHPGEHLPAGSPVLTCLADGATASLAERSVRSLVIRTLALLGCD